ncbi:MAG: lysophospholipid acyltransferase family protein [Acidobacteriota bacterium]
MSKHRLPDSPMRVVPQTPSGSLNGKPAEKPTSKAADDSRSPTPEKYTSLLKASAGVGIALGVATLGSFLLFRLLNRMKVEGLENIPESHENVLYCPNHSSILDNFALGVGLYIPRMLFRPEYIPINLADRKNFFGDPSSRRLKDRVLRVLGEYFFKNLRTFPVDRRQTGGLEQVDQWVEMLRQNIVIIFPEGTRSRTGEIGRGRAGVGKLIYEARPTVIPVRLIGTDEVLGVGKLIPSFFRTVHIIIGKPLDLSDLIDQSLPEDEHARINFYRAISNRVIEAIRALGDGRPLPMDAPGKPKPSAEAANEAEEDGTDPV